MPLFCVLLPTSRPQRREQLLLSQEQRLHPLVQPPIFLPCARQGGRQLRRHGHFLDPRPPRRRAAARRPPATHFGGAKVLVLRRTGGCWERVAIPVNVAATAATAKGVAARGASTAAAADGGTADGDAARAPPLPIVPPTDTPNVLSNRAAADPPSGMPPDSAPRP